MGNRLNGMLYRPIYRIGQGPGQARAPHTAVVGARCFTGPVPESHATSCFYAPGPARPQVRIS